MWRLKKKKKKKVGTEADDHDKEKYQEHFVKKATLTNAGMKKENVDEKESDGEEVKDVFKLTDEQLFAACGGRTAHKYVITIMFNFLDHQVLCFPIF